MSPTKVIPKRFFKGGGQLDKGRTAMLPPEPPAIERTAKDTLSGGSYNPQVNPDFVRERRRSKEVVAGDMRYVIVDYVRMVVRGSRLQYLTYSRDAGSQ